jgi:superfamily II DNA or RNA helicase
MDNENDENNENNYMLSRALDQAKNKYIDLRTNGRLFPTWVIRNFKSYKLSEILHVEGKDPCETQVETGLKLNNYQAFIGKYLDYNSPYRDILIYHGLGAGKTASAVNVYNILYNYNPGWNVFIIIKASLRDSPWMEDLEKWLEKDEKKFRLKNIFFIHYDAPNADKQFMDFVKQSDSSKKSLYIIDEVHNFISNVYSNVSSTGSKRAQNIYDYIMQDKTENDGTRVILISATPAINSPFELSLLFNLLRPNILPLNESEFNNLFISSSEYQTINTARKNLFQRRILGLTSFYIGAAADVSRYATKRIQYVDVEMDEYHREIYEHFENIEDTLAKKSRGRSGGSSMYKSYTRQACNFVFPYIDQRVNGKNRPRPNKFRLSEREAELLSEKSDKLKLEKNTNKFMNVSEYSQAMDSFRDGFGNLVQNLHSQDVKNNHTVLDDYKTYVDKYKKNYQEFVHKEKKKSSAFEQLYKCSSKFINIIFNILNSKGPTLVYSNYVVMEGFEILIIYLKIFGFHDALHNKPLGNGFGFVEYHGGISPDERKRGRQLYNHPENIYGSNVKVLLVSPAGTEGLNLMNTRQVHITEPYWHEVRINQMIGRAVRQCSHSKLPFDERYVDVFRYKSVRPLGSKWTTDQYIEDKARSKDSLIQSFLDAVKETAVDCVLYKNQNMTQEEYKCFQFEEKSLFDKHIGPAYKEDINDDILMNNGLNSLDSVVMKIKVIKITAVILLNDDSEKPQYSKSEDYWYYPQSKTVYDFEFKHPFGKILTDDDDIPLKTKNDEFIIGYVIPVPLI